MSSLKSTPRRIVTNFFFCLNAACKPPRRPHSNTPPASLPFPSRPEGAEAPSPGHSPWVFISARLAPCRGQKLYKAPRISGFARRFILELTMGFLLIMLKCSLFGDKILLASFGLTDFGLYICTKISELWIKVYYP